MRISDWCSDVCSSDLVALREVAAAFAQDVVLAFLFHAFGDDGDAKRVGHGDDSGGEGQFVRVAQDVGDEAAVDLDAVDRHAAQVAQAGEAVSEVDRTCFGSGKCVSVRGAFRGGRILKKKQIRNII